MCKAMVFVSIGILQQFHFRVGSVPERRLCREITNSHITRQLGKCGGVFRVLLALALALVLARAVSV